MSNSIISQFVNTPPTKITIMSITDDIEYDAAPGESISAQIATGKQLTVNLPQAVAFIGGTVRVKRQGTGGTIVVASTFGDTMDGAETDTLNGQEGYEGVVVQAVADGTYDVVARTVG